MYTEENEFDYNEYQDYNDVNYNNPDNKKNNSYKGIISKGLIIILAIIVITLAVYWFNSLKKGDKDPVTNKPDATLVFNNNVEMIRRAAEEYFFNDGNTPKDDSLSVDIEKLISEGFITEVKDHDNKVCSYTKSKVTLTKNQNDYKMELILSCDTLEDYFVYYYDLDYKCLTCNGEKYEPNASNEEEQNNNDENTNNYGFVCNFWSDWTDTYINESDIERRERTLIIAYKQDYDYGTWSEYSKTAITANANLEIQTKTIQESTTTKTETSEWSTSKPEVQDNRSIETKTESKTTYKKTCETVKQPTKILNYMDAAAKYCAWVGVNKYECTYAAKEVCTNKPKTTKTTYYRYTDTITNIQDVIYYRSRTKILSTPVYTNYVLESDIPVGYTKLASSAKKEYSYKAICK